MKIKEYLVKFKIPKKKFAKKAGISRWSLHKYCQGVQPARTQAWIIFNVTDGKVSFEDMGYETPPSNPLKEV